MITVREIAMLANRAEARGDSGDYAAASAWALVAIAKSMIALVDGLTQEEAQVYSINLAGKTALEVMESEDE